jgi:uncharacterized repeat protein (TIGR01451 family)
VRIIQPIRAASALIAVVSGALLLAAPATYASEPPSPQWVIGSVSVPTNFNPAAGPGEDRYRVLVTNSGSASSEGPITITDELPQGLSLDPRGAFGVNTLVDQSVTLDEHETPGEHFSCALATCVYTGVVIPDQTLELSFPVDVSPEAQGLSPLTNVVRVSGGGASAASLSEPTTISTQPASFSIPPGAATTGLSSLQAGGHPDITNTFGFSSVNEAGSLAGEPKDLTYRLPPGFASDFAGTEACSTDQFVSNECPIGSQVGVTTVGTQNFQKSSRGEYRSFVEPVYNLAPEAGVLAAIGFTVIGNFHIVGQITLRPSDYGASITFHNIDDALVSIVGGSLTVWGIPADPIHDPLRWHIGQAETKGLGYFGTSDGGVAPTPYFTNQPPVVARCTRNSRWTHGKNPGASRLRRPWTGRCSAVTASRSNRRLKRSPPPPLRKPPLG